MQSPGRKHSTRPDAKDSLDALDAGVGEEWRNSPFRRNIFYGNDHEAMLAVPVGKIKFLGARKMSNASPVRQRIDDDPTGGKSQGHEAVAKPRLERTQPPQIAGVGKHHQPERPPPVHRRTHATIPRIRNSPSSRAMASPHSAASADASPAQGSGGASRHPKRPSTET